MFTLQELVESPKWKCLDFLDFPNNWVCTDGDVITTNRRGHGIIDYLAPVIDKDGYLTYNLNYNKVKKNFKGHRLVALAFIPNPENHPQVNHNDGDKSNNDISNLFWCSNKANSYHRHRVLDKELYQARLDRYKDILDRHKKGESLKDLCIDYQLSYGYVYRLCVGSASVVKETYND